MTREERAEQAERHSLKMYKNYGEEIADSISYTTVYKSKYDTKDYVNIDDKMNKGCKSHIETQSVIKCTDTVSALLDDNSIGRTTLLNFASYRYPGGGFVKGSKAQEESLCHESTLYEILKRFQDYYMWNRNHTNNNLYLDRALYSPKVVFHRNDKVMYADVLTCAAPNKGACQLSDMNKKNKKVLRNRIKFMQSILEEHGVDIVILGAWGCGVFKQNPAEVAEAFKDIIKVPKAIYAVPDPKMYEIFKQVFNSE